MSDPKVEPKMVRESDLLAVKKREERLKEELTQAKHQIVQIQSELKVAKVDTGDSDEVDSVKKWLVDEEDRLNKMREAQEEKETSLNEREKESRVQALASEYQVDAEELKKAENPRERALELQLERLTKEKEETPSPEDVLLTTPAGVQPKKQFKDMNREELAAAEAKMKEEVLSKT